MMGGSMVPARIPDDVLGLVQTVELVVDQDRLLGDALAVLAVAERRLAAMAPNPLHDVLLIDIRDALRRGDEARDRVRPLVRRLTAVR